MPSRPPRMPPPPSLMIRQSLLERYERLSTTLRQLRLQQAALRAEILELWRSNAEPEPGVLRLQIDVRRSRRITKAAILARFGQVVLDRLEKAMPLREQFNVRVFLRKKSH